MLIESLKILEAQDEEFANQRRTISYLSDVADCYLEKIKELEKEVEYWKAVSEAHLNHIKALTNIKE